jgi:2-methylisocitrate lyase-like PEP mutase family enzyme
MKFSKLTLFQLVAARECGADMGFLEAIETEEQIKNAVKVLAPMPVRCLTFYI